MTGRWALAVALVLVLALAGCGGSDDESDDSGSSEPAATESAANFEGNEQQVAELLEQEEKANNAKDATAMCDLYSKSFNAYDCAGNADSLMRERAGMERTVTKVTIAEDLGSAEAVADVSYRKGPKGTENIHLESDGEKWEIVSWAVETPAG